MLLDALSATAHDLAIGLVLAAFVAFVCWLMVRSLRALQAREEQRCKVYVEETVPAFQWPPKPAESHPRAHEAVVPQAGRKAA